MNTPSCSHHSKLTVAVLFGGRSVEHEISIITALQAMSAMDTSRYHIVPVYIAPSGKWFTGEVLWNKKIYSELSTHQQSLQEVILLPEPSSKGFRPISGDAQRKLGLPIAIDVCFLAFHGQQGEDGCIQGLLELAGIPYTGCGVATSALAMHKYFCKGFLQSHGIPVLPSVLVHRHLARSNLKEVHQKIFSTPGLEKFPLFVKPCKLGSSIGVSRALDLPSLDGALAKAFRYDDEVLVEPCITQLMEINVSVLDGDPPIASVVEVPVAADSGVLTYEDKYLRGGGKKNSSSEGMASLTRLVDPENLDSQIKAQVQKYALEAFCKLGCSGVSRFDFIMDTSTEQLYFNELNPVPGSLAFYLWEKSTPRLLYTQIINRMIDRAIERKQEQRALDFSMEFRALK